MSEENKKKVISKKSAMIISVIAIAVLFGAAYVSIQMIKKSNESHMTKEEQLKFYTRIGEQESF